MDIVEFVAKFIEHEEAALRQVIFAFLGYATLAVAGLVLTYKEYCKNKEQSDPKEVPKPIFLLFVAFVSAALACFCLTMKFDGRKNFCIEWLPAEMAVDLDKGSVKDCNVVNMAPINDYSVADINDIKLISKFCKDYYKFDMGKGFSKKMRDYQDRKKVTQKYEEPCTSWLGYHFFQNEVRHWTLSFIFVLLSVNCYVATIRRICLRDPKAKPLFLAPFRGFVWLIKTTYRAVKKE